MVFALFLVVLLGISAFVVDIARVYALQRYERSVADAAALAGAQDLQAVGTDPRAQLTSANYTQARTDALNLLNRELGSDSGTPGCATQTASDIIDCAIPGSPYLVSIQTPSPSHVTVDAGRAVQVTVRQPNVSMTLSRVLGQGDWNVGQTSVAGLDFAPNYAVVALQTPNIKHNGTDANLCKNISVDGTGTKLAVSNGDIGTNTSAATTNSGLITLDSGYYIDYIDSQVGSSCGTNVDPTWTQVNGLPEGKPLNGYIHDPNYPYAKFDTANTYSSQSAGGYDCTTDSYYPQDPTTLAKLTTLPGGGTATPTCYHPGIYSSKFVVGTGDVAYLDPGAYWFPAGLTNGETLGGGLVSGMEGVVLVFPESNTSAGQFLANSGSSTLLNMGTYGCTGNCAVKAATDFASPQPQTIETQGGQVISIEVVRDGNCFNGTTPTYSGCSGDINQNNTVKFAGNAYLVQIGGVIYGPSDNMQITGGSSQEGQLGQVWSWTVKYTGGSQLTEVAAGLAENGVVRLDAACSGPIGFGLSPGSQPQCSPP